jgi:acyl carrier protein
LTNQPDRRTSAVALFAARAVANLAQIKPQVGFREQLDIDSMDFLNFVIGLNRELGVEVPESDYSKVSTLDGCVEYLATATSLK